MKEILQLFRRDAEHAPPHPEEAKYDMSKPRILKEASSSGLSSQESSVVQDRKVSPPVASRPTSALPREDALFGRRW